MPAKSLSQQVWLTSIQELSKSFQDTAYRRDLTVDALITLVESHLDHFKDPFQPFKTPSQDSKQKVACGKIEIPGSAFRGTPAIALQVDENIKTLALELSERVGIDQVEAAVLTQKFLKDESNFVAGPSKSSISASTLNRSKLVNNNGSHDSTLNQLIRYYQAESIALISLLTTVFTRAAGKSNHEVELLDETDLDGQTTLPAGLKARKLDFFASDLLDQLISLSPTPLVQTLFLSFAKAAHEQVNYKHGKEMAKSTTVHYLRIQAGLLEALFQLIYWDLTAINASTVVGLIQGLFGSSFGNVQANIGIVTSQNPVEAEYWLEKIESLAGMIALEALGLSGISAGRVIPIDLWDAREMTAKDDLHYVQDSEAMEAIHQTIGTVSEKCASRSPFALVLLAWSFILSRIHPDGLPMDAATSPSQDMDSPLYHIVANVALSPDTRLFEKWTAILKGSAFWKDGKAEVADGYVASYKDTMSCLMVALCTILRPPHIQDFGGLAAVFCSLYGEGSSSVVDLTTAQFWLNATADGRKEIFECAAFPLFPVALVDLLRATCGAGSRQDYSSLQLDTSAAGNSKHAWEYLNDLDEITLLFKASSDNYTRELKGQSVVITLEKDVELPSGQVLSAKTQGLLVSRPGEDQMVVKWSTYLSGWPILLSLLFAAVSSPNSEIVAKWRQFVDTSDLSAILASGLRFIQDLLTVNPDLALQLINVEDLATSTSKAPTTSVQPDVLSIALSLLDKNVITRSEPSWRQAVSSGIAIITALLPLYPQRAWSGLRSSGFFSSNRQSILTLATIIERDSRDAEYSATINCLTLITKLAEHVQLGQFQLDLQTVHGRATTLANTVPFLHQAIWARYGRWRYSNLGQKSQIAAGLVRFFTCVLRNPTSTAQITHPDVQLPLQALNTAVYDRLVKTSSDLDLLPLLEIIREPLHEYKKEQNRVVDRRPVEEALRLGLDLARHIVVVGQASNLNSGLGLLSSVTNSKERDHETDTLHVIEAVFSLATSPYLQDSTAVSALRFLDMLMLYAHGSGTAFSFMACLRSPKTTSARFVDLLARGARSMQVQGVAWQVLRTMTKFQPALARFCLKSEDDVRSVALDVALHSITASDALVKDDPALLAHAMGLLNDIYDYHPDLVSGLEIGTDAKLWQAVERFASAIQVEVSLLSREDFGNDEEDDLVDAYTRRCYRRNAKASATRLLHSVLSQSLEMPVDRADSKTALELLKSATSFKILLADSVSNAFDQELRAEQMAIIKTVISGPYIALLQERIPNSLREYGANYLFDKDVLSSIFDLPKAEKTGLIACFQLMSLNESAIVTDSEVSVAANKLAGSAINHSHEPDVAASAAYAFAAVSATTAEVKVEGDYAVLLQNQRYETLQTLLEATWIGHWEASEEWVSKTLTSLSEIFQSETFPLHLPFEQPSLPPFYRPLINTLTLYLRYTRQLTQGTATGPTLNELEDFLRSLMPVVINLLDNIFTAIQYNPGPELLQDLDCLVSCIGGLMSHSVGASSCLEQLDTRGLILRSCEMLLYMDLADETLQSITRLHWSIAQTSMGAQRLAAHGVLRAYTGTTLLQKISMTPSLLEGDVRAHSIWTTILSVARSLLSSLPFTVEYVAAEIQPFIDSMHRRVQLALAWQLDDDSVLVQLAEVHSILEIILHVVKQVEVDVGLSKQLLTRYGRPVLGYLSASTSALLRPLVVRMKVVQGFGYEKEDTNGTDKSLADAIDAADDGVVQALIVSSCSAVALLAQWVSISSAFTRGSITSTSSATKLPSVSTHMTASRILTEYASCLNDLELSPKAGLDNPRPDLPGSIASWPTVSEEKLQMIVQQALETCLMVASVQATRVYLSDLRDETRAKNAGAEEGSGEKVSGPGKKRNLDRRQGRQDLRDVVECLKRLRDGDLVPVCEMCTMYMDAQCGLGEDL